MPTLGNAGRAAVIIAEVTGAAVGFGARVAPTVAPLVQAAKPIVALTETAMAGLLATGVITAAMIEEAKADNCDKCKLADLSLGIWANGQLRGYSTAPLGNGKTLHCNPYGATNPKTGGPMRNCWVTTEAAPERGAKTGVRKLEPCHPCATRK